VVRFDAGWITLLPSGQDLHVPLARSGYDERICGFFDNTSWLERSTWSGCAARADPFGSGTSPFRRRSSGAGRSTWNRRDSGTPFAPGCSPRRAATWGCSPCTPGPQTR
jgi:hypothetical protein